MQLRLRYLVYIVLISMIGLITMAVEAACSTTGTGASGNKTYACVTPAESLAIVRTMPDSYCNSVFGVSHAQNQSKTVSKIAKQVNSEADCVRTGGDYQRFVYDFANYSGADSCSTYDNNQYLQDSDYPGVALAAMTSPSTFKSCEQDDQCLYQPDLTSSSTSYVRDNKTGNVKLHATIWKPIGQARSAAPTLPPRVKDTGQHANGPMCDSDGVGGQP